MIDNKKQERAKLHRTIWGIANDSIGSVDGCDIGDIMEFVSEDL